ncbi:MAG TPA: ABC transporter permease [bacterium]|nr:ABC transporter permease [bacterium]
MTRRWRAFLRHRLGVLGAVLVAGTLAAALGAPLFARDNPLAMHMAQTLAPPSIAHWFGTDQFGRDEWSRVLYGARLSCTVGLLSMVLAVSVGLPIGAAAGFTGGPLDAVAMRVMDAILAFPAILLAIGLVASLGPSATSGIVAIGVVYVPVIARVVRGAVLVRRREEYVDAARALGQTSWGILWRHVLPNCVAPILVQVTVGFANAIVIEAGLSFLGAGTPPPAPSWGSMLNEARQFMVSAPLTAVFPGVAISLAVLGFNLLGDGMRDVLDPRLRP